MQICVSVALIAVTLLCVPISPQGQQCSFPTPRDVEKAGEVYLSKRLSEKATETKLTVQDITFTCLSRVALSEYSSASVVVVGTVGNRPGVHEELEYQMICNASSMWVNRRENESDSIVPLMPLDTKTEFPCYECVKMTPSTPNYNPTTNCHYCHPDCLGIGGGFCTGKTADECCPFFDSNTGGCVNNCTTINPNFAPNENFTCECQIACQHGYTKNPTDCGCDLAVKKLPPYIVLGIPLGLFSIITMSAWIAVLVYDQCRFGASKPKKGLFSYADLNEIPTDVNVDTVLNNSL